jgi:capsular polysaccharide biosynthesis protein
MELNEAARRIVWQHKGLILVFVLLATAAALFAHRDDVATYTATTRFVIDAEDPTSQTESAAVADTAKAIATSPSQVREALERSGAAGRDPVEIGKRHVQLRPLGTSGVLQLSVTDPDPKVAAALADELARLVIAKRLDIKRGHLRQTVEQLDAQIKSLTERIGTLRLGTPDSTSEADLLVQRRSVLETQQLNLLASDALAAKPSIISAATLPEEANRSPVIADTVLAIVLAAIVGLGLAGLLETLSPTLVDAEAIARELDTPLIGELRGGPYRPLLPKDASRVATRLRLAARAAGVRSVGLLSVLEDLEVDGLAQLLDFAAVDPDVKSPQARVRVDVPVPAGFGIAEDPDGQVDVPAPASHACRIRGYHLEQASKSSNGDVPGLALVTPSTIKKTELAAATHLLRVSPAPLLGLVTYTPPRAPLHRVLRAFRLEGGRDGRRR